MPFFMGDDQLPVNRKTQELIATALAGDPLGVAALGLWTLAGCSSQATLTDGLLSTFALLRVLPAPDLVNELARRLVAAGFWHEPGHACEVCEPVPEGHWRFHDWWQMRYERSDVVKTTRRKRAELQRPEVVDAVWARDCIDPTNPRIARCRYCGKTVNRKDNRSPRPDRATLDHVDPTKARGARNMVVACFGCNGEKGRRTPAQAGMTLLPAPRATLDDVELPPAIEAAGSAVSPGTDAGPAAAGSPAPAAGTTLPPSPAAAGSPLTPCGGAAETPQVSPPPQAAGSTPTPRPSTDHRPNHDQTRPPTKPGPAVDQSPRARHACGAGSGEGSGAGSPTGSGSGRPIPTPAVTDPPTSPPTNPPPRRRRRRGRGGSGQKHPPVPPTATPTPSWDAGPAPEVLVVGQFGSPWHGWHGPPSPLGDEHFCPTHSLPLPCRRCAAAAEGETP